MKTQKLDSGKAPMWRGLFGYFPKALCLVAEVSQMGHDKYGEWGGWRLVPDAESRYADALLRHLAAAARGELLDPESGLLHRGHAAWNALAILELQLGRVVLDTNAAGHRVEPALPPPSEPYPGGGVAHRRDPKSTVDRVKQVY